MERQNEMTRRKIAVACVVAALAAGLVATGSALCWTVGRVREFEKAHGCDVFANLSPAEMLLAKGQKPAVSNAAPSAAESPLTLAAISG